MLEEIEEMKEEALEIMSGDLTWMDAEYKITRLTRVTQFMYDNAEEEFAEIIAEHIGELQTEERKKVTIKSIANIDDCTIYDALGEWSLTVLFGERVLIKQGRNTILLDLNKMTITIQVGAILIRNKELTDADLRCFSFEKGE